MLIHPSAATHTAHSPCLTFTRPESYINQGLSTYWSNHQVPDLIDDFEFSVFFPGGGHLPSCPPHFQSCLICVGIHIQIMRRGQRPTRNEGVWGGDAPPLPQGEISLICMSSILNQIGSHINHTLFSPLPHHP